MKRTTLVAVLVLSLLITVYFGGEKKAKAKKEKDLLDANVRNGIKKAQSQNYTVGDKDFSTTGIYFYNIRWDRKCFDYLVMMDGEAIQGTYYLEGTKTDPNNSRGSFECSNGWRCRYRKIQTKNREEVSIFEIINPPKGYRERKTINFTGKKIGR